MEEPEVPLEDVQEHIHHAAHGDGDGHGDGHGHRPHDRWAMGVALSTALFAAIAAVASLIAGQEANEAMASQIQSSDLWSYYQSKSIKANLLETKDEILMALDHAPDPKDAEKRAAYLKERDAIKEQATEKSEESVRSLARHEWMARAVTMFQVAIALSAISMLTKRRLFWMFGMGLGAIGLAFSAIGFAPAASAGHAAAADKPGQHEQH